MATPGKAVTLGTKELAALLGISRQRVNELGRKGKIEREPNGLWDPDKVRLALGRNLDSTQVRRVKIETGQESAPESDTADEPKKGTLLYEQWRLTRAKAEREELDRMVLEKTLVKSDEVRKAVTGMISAAKSRLMTMPDELCDRLAAESEPVRCREMLETKVHEALLQLSEYPASA